MPPDLHLPRDPYPDPAGPAVRQANDVAKPPVGRPRLVIDTNVWLDLLAFDDTSVERLRGSLPRFDCIASPAMRAELQAVLGRSRFDLDTERQAVAMARFDARVRLVPEPADCRLACSDPDDRVFLDTAVGHRAIWLLTRDKALLKARRHALRRHALRIGRPDDFYRWLDVEAAIASRSSRKANSTCASGSAACSAASAVENP